MNERTVVITSDSRALQFKDVLRSMWRGMVRSPYMAYRLCRKDIHAEHTQSVMGFFWDFIEPLVMGLIFYFLKRASVIDVGPMTMPYSVFVIYGLFLYQSFSESVILSMTSLKRSGHILNHHAIPPEAIILSSFFRVLFNSFFRILVMLLFSLFLWKSAQQGGMSAFSPVGFLFFLFFFPSILLVGMAIGVFCAPFSVISRDVEKGVRIVLIPLRYASPVLYPIPDVYPFSLLLMFNPVAHILDNLRQLATAGEMIDSLWFIGQMIFFSILFGIGWFIYHLAVPILTERTSL